MNVNSQVPNIVILAVNNTDEEDNAPLNYIYTNATQEKVASIGTTLVGLGRPSNGTSRRPPRHRGSTVERSISGTSMTRNTNVGSMHGSGNPTTRQHSKEGSRGGKRPLDATEVCSFHTGPTRGGSSRTPTSTASHRPDVDEDKNSNGRHLKRFVKTKVGDNIQIGLRNLNLEVEREVAMNYGNDEQVLGDDEMTDGDGTIRKEAPCNGDVVMLGVVTSNVGTLSVNLRPRHRSRAFQ
jgi:hypothetical protein